MSTKFIPIVSGIVLVLSLLGGFWAFTDHFVSADEFKAELAQTKQQIYLRLDTAELQSLTEQYYKFKALVAQHPEDQDLKIQLQEIEKQKKEAKERIDKALTNSN